jgi:hypothetical protein
MNGGTSRLGLTPPNVETPFASSFQVSVILQIYQIPQHPPNIRLPNPL